MDAQRSLFELPIPRMDVSTRDWGAGESRQDKGFRLGGAFIGVLSSEKLPAVHLRKRLEAATGWSWRGTRKIIYVNDKPAGLVVYDEERITVAAIQGKYDFARARVEDHLRAEWKEFQPKSQLDAIRTSWQRWIEKAPTHGRGQDYGERIALRYSEGERRLFHVPYLLRCVKLAKEAQEHLANPLALELAVWFHRIIYDPQRDDNFKNSAEVVRQVVNRLQLPDGYKAAAEHIEQLSGTPQGDGKYLLDIHHSPLASSETEFDDLVDMMEKISGEQGPAKVRQDLDSLVQEGSIFRTSYFRQQYEPRAWGNIHRKLKEYEIRRTGNAEATKSTRGG